MSKPTTNPLQVLVNTNAIKKAEAQYRLARLFTPYGFTPERVDFDRVGSFVDDVFAAFPQPTEAIRASLDRVQAQLNEATAILQAFEAQGVTPTLDEEQLYITARNNVVSPGNARAA